MLFIFRNTTRKINQCDLTEENRYWSLKEIIFGASTLFLILIIIVITAVACCKRIRRRKLRKIYIYTYIKLTWHKVFYKTKNTYLKM